MLDVRSADKDEARNYPFRQVILHNTIFVALVPGRESASGRGEGLAFSRRSGPARSLAPPFFRHAKSQKGAVFQARSSASSGFVWMGCDATGSAELPTPSLICL